MTTAVEADRSPHELLKVLGHPLRWRLLTDLARSDRTVVELTGLAGEPQNLVSYHLAKLRDARLVSSRRSSADRRDTYYAADLGRLGWMLAAAGTALHPGIRLVPSDGAAARPARSGRPLRVLFLCTGNSARSQMAEALARQRSGGAIEAASAGSAPKPLHPTAVEVMRERYGIDLTSHRSKHISDLPRRRFDRVVTLCDRVREVCPDFPGAPETTHWSIADPAAEEQDDGDAFRRVAEELDTRVGFLVAALLHPAP